MSSRKPPATGAVWLLSDTQWRKIAPLLPKQATGRPRHDDRLILSGIVLALETGCPWSELPSDYGKASTLQQRHRRWADDGTMGRICEALNVKAQPRYQRYGIRQRQEMRRQGRNPWLSRPHDDEWSRMFKLWR